MARLPKRTKEHVIDEQAIKFIKDKFPPSWIFESGEKDYGIDLIGEIVKNGFVTGAHFLIQSKGTFSPNFAANNCIRKTCKTSTLQYFLERPEMVLFIIVDKKNNIGYWIWIQDYIRNSLDKKWKNQESATIDIPLANKLDKNSVENIEKRVLAAHDQNIWLTAMQTSQNADFDYQISFDKKLTNIYIYNKHPEDLKNNRIEITGTFSFDKSAEGQDAYKALENSFKTGESVRIDSRFIKSFDLSQLIPELSTHLDKIDVKEIQIKTAIIDEHYPLRIELLDEFDNSLTEIPYVDFKLLKGGIEEKTFTNDNQLIPLKVIWRHSIKGNSSSFSFKLQFFGINVNEIQRYSTFYSAIEKAHKINITYLRDGSTMQGSLPKLAPQNENNSFFRIVDDLVRIQKSTGTKIDFPEGISSDDLLKIEGVIEIIKTGLRITKNKTISIKVSKDMAPKVFSSYETNEVLGWEFHQTESIISLLGTSIDLGPCTIKIPKARLDPQTKSEFIGSANSDYLKMLIDIEEPGIITTFSNWPKKF